MLVYIRKPDGEVDENGAINGKKGGERWKWAACMTPLYHNKVVEVSQTSCKPYDYRTNDNDKMFGFLEEWCTPVYRGDELKGIKEGDRFQVVKIDNPEAWITKIGDILFCKTQNDKKVFYNETKNFNFLPDKDLEGLYLISVENKKEEKESDRKEKRLLVYIRKPDGEVDENGAINGKKGGERWKWAACMTPLYHNKVVEVSQNACKPYDYKDKNIGFTFLDEWCTPVYRGDQLKEIKEGDRFQVVKIDDPEGWRTKIGDILVYRGTQFFNDRLGPDIYVSKSRVKELYLIPVVDGRKDEEENKKEEKENNMEMKSVFEEVLQSGKEGAKLAGSAEAAELMVTTFHKLLEKVRPEWVVLLRKGGDTSIHLQATVLAVGLKIFLKLYPQLPYSKEADTLSDYVIVFETAKLFKPTMKYVSDFVKALVSSAGHLLEK